MTLFSKLKGKAIDAYLGEAGSQARATWASLRRRATGQPNQVDFFFDVADPWSYLTAQAVQRLSAHYPVELSFHLVSPPASEFDPAPALRVKHAVRDAADLAAHYQLEFTAQKPEPDSNMVRKANSILTRERPSTEQLAIAIELGEAVWGHDHKRLTELLGRHGAEAMGAVAPTLFSNYEELRRHGHYQGAMLGYGGDWYWGIDRLPYLEARLRKEHAVTAPPLVAPRPLEARPPARLVDGDRVPLEVWYSFGSPYAYLALEQLEGLALRHRVELKLRPVLPTSVRTRPVPRTKQLYIARDAKREAHRLGLPFGSLCDPRGKGIDHVMAIAKRAIELGQGFEVSRSLMRGIWSEAQDVSSYVDLRRLVERGGMDWNEAKVGLADDSWRAWTKAHADDLEIAGHWGVPCFRAGSYVTWGQDRIPLLEDRLRRHAAAPAPRPVAASAPATTDA